MFIYTRPLEDSPLNSVTVFTHKATERQSNELSHSVYTQGQHCGDELVRHWICRKHINALDYHAKVYAVHILDSNSDKKIKHITRKLWNNTDKTRQKKLQVKYPFNIYKSFIRIITISYSAFYGIIPLELVSFLI